MDVNEDLEEEQPMLLHPGRKSTRVSWSSCCVLFLVQCVLLCISIILLTFAKRGCNLESNYCVKRLSSHSPALEVFDDDYHSQRFEGTFAKSNPYKGAPSDSLDWAWKPLVDANASTDLIRISKEDLAKIDPPPHPVKIPAEAGGGYLASLDGLHQLHCLNLLRYAIHEDYYKTRAPEWTDPPAVVRQHIDHCVDILRQKLMCDADATVMTFNWVRGRPTPYPNFNVQHKCRDYGALQEWQRKHAFEYPISSLKPMPDEIILDRAP